MLQKTFSSRINFLLTISLLCMTTLFQANITYGQQLTPELAKDINTQPNTGARTPYEGTSFKGSLYFAAYADSVQYGLWKSNGTVAGTTLVKDLAPGRQGDGIYEITIVGDLLYISIYQSIWKSDGTEEGTVLATHLPSYARDMIAVGIVSSLSVTILRMEMSFGKAMVQKQELRSSKISILVLPQPFNTIIVELQSVTLFSLWQTMAQADRSFGKAMAQKQAQYVSKISDRAATHQRLVIYMPSATHSSFRLRAMKGGENFGKVMEQRLGQYRLKISSRVRLHRVQPG